MIAPLNSGLRPNLDGGLNAVGNEYSAECVEREWEGMYRADAEQPRTLDQLCLAVDYGLSRIMRHIDGICPTDSKALTAALQSGLAGMSIEADAAQFATFIIAEQTAAVKEKRLLPGACVHSETYGNGVVLLPYRMGRHMDWRYFCRFLDRNADVPEASVIAVDTTLMAAE